MKLHLVALVLAALGTSLVHTAASTSAPSTSLDLDVLMPPHETFERDSYLCMRVPLPQGTPERSTFSLIGFEPIADQSKVHHMLLFGCKDGPANTVEDVWDCRMRSPCEDADVVLYGWGRNAPPVSLPAGSGYTVGSRSSNKHLVLQIHFLDLRPKEDESGLRLKLSKEPLDQAVSLQAFARGFMIPPGRSSYPVRNECCYNSIFPMKSFASRVHTHALGRRVSLDITSPSNVVNRLVVDSDPLQPQGFYPVNKTYMILPGDRMKMTCEFDSTDKLVEVYAGHTSEDEMCNLYLMAASPVATFSMCVLGAHLIKSGQGLGTNIIPELDTQLWDSVAHHTDKGFGQIPGLFYSNIHAGSVWMFYRRDADWTPGTFHGTRMGKEGFVRDDTISLVDLRTGAVKMSLGADLFMMPHMISEAEDGSLWVTDVGAHLVHKLSPDTGKILATLGGGREHRPNNPGSDTTRFCQPTEAIETRDGRVLVSDGYCNNRVMEFDAKTLKLVKTHDLMAAVPEKYRTIGPLLPHSLAYDECTKTMIVALRMPQIVIEIDIESDMDVDDTLVTRHYDLAKFGQPMAVRLGMYGAKYALTQSELETHLVELGSQPQHMHTSAETQSVSRSWKLPGPSFAHDFIFVPGPEFEDGTLERNVSLIVTETKQQKGSRSFKYVFHDALTASASLVDTSLSDVQTGARTDAAVHINTDDLVVSSSFRGDAYQDGMEPDDGIDEHEKISFMTHARTDSPTPERYSHVFMLSLGLAVVVLWGFLQTLDMTIRSMKSNQ